MTAVDYAEQQLGVHSVYEEACNRLDQHTECTAKIADFNIRIRLLKKEIEDAEIQIASDERAKEHGLSKTAFSDHLKEVLKTDSNLRDLRTKLADLEVERSNEELRAKHHSLGLQLSIGRLHELGGLLHFYAATKLAEIA